MGRAYLSTAVDVGGLAHYVVHGGPDGGRAPMSVAREGSYGLTGGTQRDVLPGSRHAHRNPEQVRRHVLHGGGAGGPADQQHAPGSRGPG
jgi:hypothetical protein